MGLIEIGISNQPTNQPTNPKQSNWA